MLETIVEPLGYTADMQFAYYVLSTQTIRILKPAQHREAEFLALDTEDEWQAALQLLPVRERNQILVATYRNREYVGEEIDWTALGAELMRLCREKGEYDPTIGRGRGLWQRSTGELIFNTGRELWSYDNGQVERTPLHKITLTPRDPHRYLSGSPPATPPADTPATKDGCRALLYALGRFEWLRREVDPRIILGWIACATILNLIEFRPQVAVTAERGAGKSALLGFLVRIFGPDTNCIHVEADISTEPGIRQTHSTDALPVICDEFETTGKHADDLLKLFRIASNPKSPSGDFM